METKSVCLVAEETVNGPRAAAYGSALVNHDRIAKIWSVVLGVPVTAEQVALCMVGTKIARLCHSPGHYDSVLDIAGYAAVYEKILAERKNG